jgi:hypothetical protein
MSGGRHVSAFTRSRTSIEEVLVDGLTDYVYEAGVLSVAAMSGLVAMDALRELSVGIIAELLTEGYQVAGSVNEDGFAIWPESPGEAVGRISRNWVHDWADDYPTPGAIVWLSNTEAGDAIAREVLAREASPRHLDGV